MDLPNHEQTTMKSDLNLKFYAEEDESNAIPSKRLCYSPPSRRQSWSIPDSIIYYIAKNPSTPDVYEKLIQSCKYFFFKNPVIVCSTLAHHTEIYYNPFNVHTTVTESFIKQDGTKQFTDLNDIANKLWITKDIIIDANENPEIMSIIIPKIYRFDAKYIFLCDLIIPWNEYVFLVSNVVEIQLLDVVVRYENGSVVPFEKLVEPAVTANSFIFDFENVKTNISFATIKNLLKVPHFFTLKYFSSGRIPGDSFDIETFYTYIKKNKNTYFDLHFSPVSEAYKNRLKAINEEIIVTKIFTYKVPFITYHEQSGEERRKLGEILMLSNRNDL